MKLQMTIHSMNVNYQQVPNMQFKPVAIAPSDATSRRSIANGFAILLQFPVGHLRRLTGC